MKKAIALFLVLLALMSVSAPALALVEVEEYDNLQPPMKVVDAPASTWLLDEMPKIKGFSVVVTYEYAAPPAVVVDIPAYSPEPEQPAPDVTPEPTEPPKPVETPMPTQTPSDVKGDYSKGTVYGPSLSSRERKALKVKVGEIVSACVTEGMTDREKIVALVNYVYDHGAYADDWSKNRANTAWGLLVYGEAQCSGYARGMVALFDAAGVESRYVHAAKDDPINPSHQWNMVMLDGKWYHLDVQMLDSSYGGTSKPILLMGNHLTYDESKLPRAAGESLTLQ